MNERIERNRWIVGSKFGEEKQVMEAVERTLRLLGSIGSARLQDIRTAVSEACLNAFEHGNRFHRDKQVEVRLAVDSESIVIWVADEGDGFAYHPEDRFVRRKLEEENPRGWGLLLMAELADDIRFGKESGKHTVRLTFYREHK